MKVDDINCVGCNAGFRRIELSSRRGAPGQYRCPICNGLVEVLDGSNEVAYRLIVFPAKKRGFGFFAQQAATFMQNKENP